MSGRRLSDASSGSGGEPGRAPIFMHSRTSQQHPISVPLSATCDSANYVGRSPMRLAAPNSRSLSSSTEEAQRPVVGGNRPSELEGTSFDNSKPSKARAASYDGLSAGAGKLRSFLPHDVVTLNVGGRVFVTSVMTLTKHDSMLSAMFSGRFPLQEDPNGAVFIDRDGRHFHAVLNFLRDGDLALAYPRDKTLCLSLRREAEYYQLLSMRAMLDEFLDEAPAESQGKRGNFSIGKQVTVLKTEAEKEALLKYGTRGLPIVLLEVSSSSFGDEKDAIIFKHLALFDRLCADFGAKLAFVKQIVYTGKEWKFYRPDGILQSHFSYFNQFNGRHSFQEEIILDRILKLILSADTFYVQSGIDASNFSDPLTSPSLSPSTAARREMLDQSHGFVFREDEGLDSYARHSDSNSDFAALASPSDDLGHDVQKPLAKSAHRKRMKKAKQSLGRQSNTRHGTYDRSEMSHDSA